MKCVECTHFVVRQTANMPWDTGVAACEKHDLICNYVSKQQLERLECIEGSEEEE